MLSQYSRARLLRQLRRRHAATSELITALEHYQHTSSPKLLGQILLLLTLSKETDEAAAAAVDEITRPRGPTTVQMRRRTS